MTSAEYRRLRESIVPPVTQAGMARLLGISLRTYVARENDGGRITPEAAYAMKHLVSAMKAVPKSKA